MQAALDDAGIEAKDIQYLNAHGTSTPVGDLYEVQALYRNQQFQHKFWHHVLLQILVILLPQYLHLHP
jgi:3-oxoacyl-(acyl-carrier-protein) synthase